MKHDEGPGLLPWLRGCFRTAQAMGGVSSELGMLNYVIAQARAKGLTREQFLTWVERVWEVSE